MIFEVGDRVRFTSPEFEDLLISRGDTGTITGVEHDALRIAWDKEDHRDSPTPWAPEYFEKITPRVGHDRFQPGDKVKYRAGRTKRASRIGTVTSTGVDLDGVSFAVVATPGGVTADVGYEDLKMVRPHPSGDEPPSFLAPRAVTVSFTYDPDSHLPRIATLDDLLTVLAESPDDLTITEEPA